MSKDVLIANRRPLHQSSFRKVVKTRMSRSGIPNFWYLMPDDLRWSWCNNNRNKVHNKYNVFESSPKHPPGESMKKPPSRKPVPAAKKVGDHSVERTMIGKEIEKADLNNNFNKCDYEGKDREIRNRALDLEYVCLLHTLRMGEFEHLHGWRSRSDIKRRTRKFITQTRHYWEWGWMILIITLGK